MKARTNPRYVAYARAHGRTPDEQYEHDRERWSGGAMTGFLCWMSQRRQAFLRLWPCCQPNNGFAAAPVASLHAESWDRFLQACADRRIPLRVDPLP